MPCALETHWVLIRLNILKWSDHWHDIVYFAFVWAEWLVEWSVAYLLHVAGCSVGTAHGNLMLAGGWVQLEGLRIELHCSVILWTKKRHHTREVNTISSANIVASLPGPHSHIFNATCKKSISQCRFFCGVINIKNLGMWA